VTSRIEIAAKKRSVACRHYRIFRRCHHQQRLEMALSPVGNAAAERLFGYKPEEIVGKIDPHANPPDRHHEEPGIIETDSGRGEPITITKPSVRRKDARC